MSNIEKCESCYSKNIQYFETIISFGENGEKLEINKYECEDCGNVEEETVVVKKINIWENKYFVDINWKIRNTDQLDWYFDFINEWDKFDLVIFEKDNNEFFEKENYNLHNKENLEKLLNIKI